MIPEFSPALRTTLARIYLNNELTDSTIDSSERDAFVDHILAEARPALVAMHWLRRDTTNEEKRAERDSLTKSLEKALKAFAVASSKLGTLSPDFDRLLDLDRKNILATYADPLGCKDSIEKMIALLKQAKATIDAQPKVKRPLEEEHSIAIRLAIDVLRAIRTYGIEPRSTVRDGYRYTADAEAILRTIGDDIGITRAALTWRDIIAQAKLKATDLSVRDAPKP